MKKTYTNDMMNSFSIHAELKTNERNHCNYFKINYRVPGCYYYPPIQKLISIEYFVKKFCVQKIFYQYRLLKKILRLILSK